MMDNNLKANNYMSSNINNIPHILVKDLDGTPKDLILKYKNEILLLIIYNNDCLGCTGRAIPLAYEFQQKYPSIKLENYC